MRKTPLSAPGGSYGRRNNYDFNYRDRSGSGSGYGHNQSDDKQGGYFVPGQNQQPSPQKASDDFIPLGFSSPVNNQRPFYNNNSGNWRGHGNSQRHRGTPPSPGCFNNSYRRNFYHDTPKSSFNESNSPRFYQKNHFGPRRPHQKDAHRKVDISNYLNIKSILEDPWADLVKNLEKRRSENGNKVETPVSAAGGSSSENILSEDRSVESDSTDLNLVSQESEITVPQKSEIISTTTTTTTTAIITTAAS